MWPLRAEDPGTGAFQLCPGDVRRGRGDPLRMVHSTVRARRSGGLALLAHPPDQGVSRCLPRADPCGRQRHISDPVEPESGGGFPDRTSRMSGGGLTSEHWINRSGRPHTCGSSERSVTRRRVRERLDRSCRWPSSTGFRLPQRITTPHVSASPAPSARRTGGRSANGDP
jgi:hypothetical protein